MAMCDPFQVKAIGTLRAPGATHGRRTRRSDGPLLGHAAQLTWGKAPVGATGHEICPSISGYFSGVELSTLIIGI
jgi:hypothetical protein